MTKKKPTTYYKKSNKVVSELADQHGYHQLAMDLAASYFSLFGEGMWAYRLRSKMYWTLKATKASSAAVSRAATTAADTASASMICSLCVGGAKP